MQKGYSPTISRAGIPGFAHATAGRKKKFALTRKKKRSTKTPPQNNNKNTKKTPTKYQKIFFCADARIKTSRVRKKTISDPTKNGVKPKKSRCGHQDHRLKLMTPMQLILSTGCASRRRRPCIGGVFFSRTARSSTAIPRRCTPHSSLAHLSPRAVNPGRVGLPWPSAVRSGEWPAWFSTPQDVGPCFRRNFIPRRPNLGKNQPGLPNPNPKPTPAWLGGWVR